MSAAPGGAGAGAAVELTERWLMNTYRRAPVEFVRGEGTRLWDAGGREYLDFLAGISVCSLGHGHPAVQGAIERQSRELMHVSNLFHSLPGAELGRRLCESSLGGRAFLCNSGTEANECAIKLVRKHAHRRGVERPRIVVLEGAFHGRTMGALSATPKLSDDPAFGPYLEGFDAVPRDDPGALADAVGADTAAVMLEPIQGESGVHVISPAVIEAAAEACGKVGAVLVFDEIQCGMGRTGSLWAYQQLGVTPGVLTTAKALGGGLPAGACVAAPPFSEVLEPGDHGSTFAGGLLAAAVAVAVLETIGDPALLAAVTARGERLRAGLESLAGVESVRGRGLMVGAALADGLDAPAVAARLLELGLIVNAPDSSTLRLLPPLTVSGDEVDSACALIAEAIA